MHGFEGLFRLAGSGFPHRPLSSSFLWLIFLESYKVTPKIGNYLGAHGVGE